MALPTQLSTKKQIKTLLAESARTAVATVKTTRVVMEVLGDGVIDMLAPDLEELKELQAEITAITETDKLSLAVKEALTRKLSKQLSRL